MAKKLYVGNLSYGMTDSDLQYLTRNSQRPPADNRGKPRNSTTLSTELLMGTMIGDGTPITGRATAGDSSTRRVPTTM